jgi:hypothetical protein
MLGRGVKSARRHVRRGIFYEPLLLETHLQQLSGHLDRALAFRRELRELVVLAVKAASEYDLFRLQSPLNLALDLERLGREEKTIGAAAQEAAAGEFGNADALARGFAAIAGGTGRQLREAVAGAGREEALLRQIAANSAAYQDAYWARHSEPGNAHNYGERARLVGLLYGQDWLIAQAKARAVAAGYARIHGSGAPAVPAMDGIEGLDRLVVWTREMVELLQVRTSEEVEYDLVVPLVQARTVGGERLITPADFLRALQRTDSGRRPLRLQFTLPPGLFAGLTGARLRRVGLAYGMKKDVVEGSGIDRNTTIQAPYRYRARIATPRQAAAGNAAERSRPPVMLGDVSLYGGSPAYSDGQEVTNLDPVGAWEIEVHPVPVVKDDADAGLVFIGGDNAWLDVKLFLRLRGRPVAARPRRRKPS